MHFIKQGLLAIRLDRVLPLYLCISPSTYIILERCSTLKVLLFLNGTLKVYVHNLILKSCNLARKYLLRMVCMSWSHSNTLLFLTA